MFIELVELLRCIRAHDESWLVAAIEELADRSIIRGKLGCPVCQAEYPVANGVADFSGGHGSATHRARPLGDPTDVAMRAGAFLGLAESTGAVILGGSWAAGASDLVESTEARVFAANHSGSQTNNGVGQILVGVQLPFAASSCAGVALDDSFSAETLTSAIRVIRPGGRIVAPATLSRPATLELLAEDDEWWVARKPPELTTLRKGSR